jgi:hypothetical protein
LRLRRRKIGGIEQIGVFGERGETLAQARERGTREAFVLDDAAGIREQRLDGFVASLFFLRRGHGM